jgi:hypothetical protein
MSVGVAEIPTSPIASMPQIEYFTTFRALSEVGVVPQSHVERSAFCWREVMEAGSDLTQKKRARSGQLFF